MAAQRLTTTQRDRVLGLLAAEDPHGEVRLAWAAKETLRCVCGLDPKNVEDWITEFVADTTDPPCRPTSAASAEPWAAGDPRS